MLVPVFLVLLLTSGWICYETAAENSYNSESSPVVLIDVDSGSLRDMSRRFVTGHEEEKDPNDPKYQMMAEDLVYSQLRIKQESVNNITVYKVTTQVTGGFVTRLQLRVLSVDGKSLGCSFKVFEQPWKNVKHISYTCDSMNASEKLSSNSGDTDNTRPEQERDPSNPKYQELARASLKDWFANNNDRKPFKENDVDNIHVASVKTKLSSKIWNILKFIVAAGDDNFECTSRISETPWNPDDPRQIVSVKCGKRTGDNNFMTSTPSYVNKGMPGDERIQNPHSPKWRQLAEESFTEYRIKHLGFTIKVDHYEVKRATTQVVSGIITRLDFDVITVQGTSFPCQSKIWEHGKKEITVNCQVPPLLPTPPDENGSMTVDFSQTSTPSYVNNGMPGDERIQNPHSPKWRQLAEESFTEYRMKHLGFTIKVDHYKVKRATTQVVSGRITRLDFDVITVQGTSFPCQSKIWEHGKKEITVNCQVPPLPPTPPDENGSMTGDFSQTPTPSYVNNGGLPGVITKQDPRDPKYKELADESLSEYRKKHLTVTATVYQVYTVTTQVVSGIIITRLDFAVLTWRHSFPCHSEIWEHGKKVIKSVTCEVPPGISKLSMSQFNSGLPGGITEQDPDDPKYKKLAEESFTEYRIKHLGFLVKAKDYQVAKVTTQVVSGIITRLDFVVIPVRGTSFQCRSEIWEHGKKEITVTCQVPPGNSKLSLAHANRGMTGGITEQDPDDPKYKKLAEESFTEYRIKHLGFLVKAKDYRVTKATTQVVSGYLTQLEFDVIPEEGSSFPCHSEILEHGKREITVTCQLRSGYSHSGKGRVVGGETEQDPNDPKYKELAEESFREYRKNHIGLLVKAKDYKVIKVTTQVVAGFVTKIDFYVITTRGKHFPCHSKIFEPTGPIKKPDINVQCEPSESKSSHMKMYQSNDVGRPGGEVDEDSHDPKYWYLAKNSFESYLKSHNSIKIRFKDLKVEKVTTQVVDGTITYIDFHVLPIRGRPIPCHSEVHHKHHKTNYNAKCRLNQYSK